MGRSQVLCNQTHGRGGRGRGRKGAGRGQQSDGGSRRRHVVKGDNSWRFSAEEQESNPPNTHFTASEGRRDVAAILLGEDNNMADSYLDIGSTESIQLDQDFDEKGLKDEDLVIDCHALNELVASIPATERLKLPKFIGEWLDRDAGLVIFTQKAIHDISPPRLVDVDEDISPFKRQCGDRSIAQNGIKDNMGDENSSKTEEKDKEEEEDLDAWLDSMIS